MQSAYDVPSIRKDFLKGSNKSLKSLIREDKALSRSEYKLLKATAKEFSGVNKKIATKANRLLEDCYETKGFILKKNVMKSEQKQDKVNKFIAKLSEHLSKKYRDNNCKRKPDSSIDLNIGELIDNFKKSKSELSSKVSKLRGDAYCFIHWMICKKKKLDSSTSGLFLGVAKLERKYFPPDYRHVSNNLHRINDTRLIRLFSKS